MLKKLTIATALFGLMACNSQLLSGQSNMAYKISDKEVEEFILKGNALEQCIYPELRQANNEPEKLDKIYKSHSPAEKSTMWGAIWYYSLPQDISYIIQTDKASLEYFNSTYARLNHSKPTAPPYELTSQQCHQFKAEFAQNVKQNEKAIKEGKIQLNKESRND